MKFILCASFVFCLFSEASRALAEFGFQSLDRDQEFSQRMTDLDLNCSDCSVHYKDSGTSVGIKIKRGGKGFGKWVPKNSATNPESQVVAYQLGRFLHMSEQVMPSSYHALSGAGLVQFKKFLTSAREVNKWRRINRDATLKELGKAPKEMSGVYTPKLDFDTPEVIGLANPRANTIDPSHTIAKMIRANGPVPTDRMVSLKGVKTNKGLIPQATEMELARQFSKIMVLDILVGQWDRWSGGNVEAGYDKTTNRVFLIARDNGGGSLRGEAKFTKYFGIVTRFDRDQVERLRELRRFLEDPVQSKELVKELGLRSPSDILLIRVKKVLAHVENQEKRFGTRAYF